MAPGGSFPAGSFKKLFPGDDQRDCLYIINN